MSGKHGWQWGGRDNQQYVRTYAVDDQCEALATIDLHWMPRGRRKLVRRCGRRAQISRAGRTLCWQHDQLPIEKLKFDIEPPP